MRILSTEIIGIVENVYNFQDISRDEPYEIDVLTSSVELMIRFPIPIENVDNTIYYSIIVKTSDETVDTTTGENVDARDMQLSKDRPIISFTEPLGTINKTYTISPIVSDNSEVKNVTYYVYNATWSMSITITNLPWYWQWETFNTITNGPYTLKMTVYDYAGLSATVNNIPFSVENE